MSNAMDYPFLVLVLTFAGLWLSEQVGASFLARRAELEDGIREDFGHILTGTLTLLALLIGFIFLMATTRYDQRKNYEEEEANAIGTEYARADLLPAADAEKVRALLKSYLDQRVLFYTTTDQQQIRQIDTRTARLQSELWSAVVAPASAQPTPVVALAVSGMNDVLNTQGYTQAAWLNRIPPAAWILVALIAICSNVLLGYGARKAKGVGRLLLVLPLVVSVSFFLIADIDSPRAGLIHVYPQNLASLVESLRAH
jgi:hypothetical protein